MTTNQEAALRSSIALLQDALFTKETGKHKLMEYNVKEVRRRLLAIAN